MYERNYPFISKRELIKVKMTCINSYRQGPKTGMDFRGQVLFWSEIESDIGEPGGTPSPRIPRSTPPPPELIKIPCRLPLC